MFVSQTWWFFFAGLSGANWRKISWTIQRSPCTNMYRSNHVYIHCSFTIYIYLTSNTHSKQSYWCTVTFFVVTFSVYIYSIYPYCCIVTCFYLGVGSGNQQKCMRDLNFTNLFHHCRFFCGLKIPASLFWNSWILAAPTDLEMQKVQIQFLHRN